MSTDYIVASLPTLAFNAPAPITWEKFAETAPDAERLVAASGWNDLETQLRNAMAAARGGAKYERPADGCSLYWKNRVTTCFQEKDVAKRQDMIDRVWWDAAGELTPPASPLQPSISPASINALSFRLLMIVFVMLRRANSICFGGLGQKPTSFRTQS